MQRQTNKKTLSQRLKSNFDLKSWVGYHEIDENTKFLKKRFQELFIPRRNSYKASFEEATERYHLQDKDIQEKRRSLLWLSVIMVIFGCAVLGYAGYHLFSGGYRAVLLSMVIALISFALAFRYHFWAFQLKQKKLGCTIKEWFYQGLLGINK